jgi:protein-S-isoprenylcysteine O-methyltransferase Ste14
MIQKLRIRISQIFAVLLIAIIALSSSYWEVQAPFVTSILYILGCILVGIASVGRLWCSLYISGYRTSTLITVGPYSMCRNPLYFFSLLGAIGVGLASESLLIPTIIAVAFALYYPSVIQGEEAKLRTLHGGEFETYFKTTPRFFPKISLLKEPEEYTVKPLKFRRQIFDALWFVWLIGILELIEELHELNILPALFRIF